MDAITNSDWKIAWNEDLSVGVPEIDEEHRCFIGRVNDLNRGLIDRVDKATIQSLMDLVVTEATEHFDHEERVLARAKYPGAAAHAAIHANLTRQLLVVLDEFRKSELSAIWIGRGLLVKTLLVHHLVNEDMKYRDFLRTRAGPR
jgi:hemerythrin-like metal-binding protein